MPIKYNLTKNDILADKFHKLSQRAIDSSSNEDRILNAAAILIASFSSAHSWRTNTYITNSTEINKLRSPEVKSEYTDAKRHRWKTVTSKDIQEVSQMNINASQFATWLSNTDKSDGEIYKLAWNKLQSEFDKECDNKELNIA